MEKLIRDYTENVLRFIQFQYTPILIKEMLSKSFLMMLITIVFTVWGKYKGVVCYVFLIIELFFIVISFLFLYKRKTINRYVFDGLWCLIMSMMFMYSSYNFMNIHHDINLIWLIVLYTALLINIGVFIIVTIQNIKRDVYNVNKKKNSVKMWAYIGSITAAIILRFSFGNTEIYDVLSVFFAILSLLTSIGCINLLKAILQNKLNT